MRWGGAGEVSNLFPSAIPLYMIADKLKARPENSMSIVILSYLSGRGGWGSGEVGEFEHISKQTSAPTTICKLDRVQPLRVLR